jgi:hypothetical protein
MCPVRVIVQATQVRRPQSLDVITVTITQLRRQSANCPYKWLLARLDPKRFALPWEQRGDSDAQAESLAAFPALLDAITDVPAN